MSEVRTITVWSILSLMPTAIRLAIRSSHPCLASPSATRHYRKKLHSQRRTSIKDRNLTEPTRKVLEYALKRTYDKDEFVRMLKEKGIDCVFRYTDEGRIYGATFIDHRTHCVLNGSRMGKAFSANALEQHFNTPPEEQIPFKEIEEQEEQPNSGSTSTEGQQQSTSRDKQEHYESKGGLASFLDALDILNTDNPVTDAEEEAFRRKLQRKKKKRRGPKL